MVHDLREILRFAEGRDPEPTADVLDSRTMQSTVESGGRARYNAYKRKKGLKVHAAVDTWGTCWLCTSHRPTNRIGSRSLSWPRRCRK
jgi:hypothetical protein